MPILESPLSALKRAFAAVSGRKPGLSEAACHLVKHENYSSAQAVQLLQELFFPSIMGARSARTLHQYEMSRFVADGRKRLARGYSCRFCNFS